jgi:hypothetical protein
MMPIEGATFAQAAEFFVGHDAGIEVRQQPGFAAYQFGHRAQVIERGGKAQRGQGIAGGAITQLGLVAEREQRLMAAGRLTSAGDVKHLFG